MTYSSRTYDSNTNTVILSHVALYRICGENISSMSETTSLTHHAAPTVQIRKKIVPLTSVRGICALIIYGFHALYDEGKIPLPFRCMASVVSFFFILSGFMMVWCYHHCDLSNWKCKGSFMVRRIARIYPALIIIFASHFLFSLLLGHSENWLFLVITTPLLIVSLTICNLDDPIIFFIHHWAVSVEFLFYVVFIFVFPFIRRSYDKVIHPGVSGLRWWTFWVLTPVLLYTWTVVPIFLPSPFKNWSCVRYFTFPMRFSECFLGVWAGFVGLHYLHPAWSRASATTKKFVGFTIDCFIIMVTVFISFVAPYMDEYHDVPFVRLLQTGMLSPVGVLVVFTLSLDVGLVAKLFHLRPLEVLGEISYELYLLHQFVVQGYSQLHVALGWALSRGSVFYLTMPYTFAASYFFARHISEPLYHKIVAAVSHKYPQMKCNCKSHPPKPTPVDVDLENRGLLNHLVHVHDVDEERS